MSRDEPSPLREEKLSQSMPDMNAERSIILLQTIMPHYRRPILQEIYRRRAKFRLFAGDDFFTPAMRTSSWEDGFIRRSRNIFLFNRRILFQFYDFRAVFRADVVVVEFNPRIINSWIVLVARRLLGRPTVLWGHAWSRSGRKSWSEIVRRQMKRLATVLLAYTRTDQREMSDDMPATRVYAAPNSLYPASQMMYCGSPSKRTSFICVGRLVPEKKVDVLLHGFAAYRKQRGDATLRIVGDGPEAPRLHALVGKLDLGEAVRFEGHVGEPERLKSWYSESIASISPGYVGLSLTQSLAFGIPMIISRNEPHAPEIEAAFEGFTARFFDTDNPGALAEAMIEMEAGLHELEERAPKIVEFCRKHYSIEAMVGGILEAVDASVGARAK